MMGSKGSWKTSWKGITKPQWEGDVAWTGVNSGHVQTVRILDFFFLRTKTMRFADGLDMRLKRKKEVEDDS